MEGKEGSCRETLTWVQLPNWTRGSNLGARPCLCARKGPRAPESGPVLQLLHEVPVCRCRSRRESYQGFQVARVFWRQANCPEQCPWWHQSSVCLPNASSSLNAHPFLASCLWPNFGFVCTPCVGEALLHRAPQKALLGEAEAPGRAEEGLSTPAQLFIQSFGDGLCTTVGRGEFEHKGLSTQSIAPEPPHTPCWAFLIPKITACSNSPGPLSL